MESPVSKSNIIGEKLDSNFLERAKYAVIHQPTREAAAKSLDMTVSQFIKALKTYDLSFRGYANAIYNEDKNTIFYRNCKYHGYTEYKSISKQQIHLRCVQCVQEYNKAKVPKYTKQKIFEVIPNQCERCKEYFHPSLLEFHHINPKEKSFTIAHALQANCSLPKVMDEIKKCKVVCGNCHKLEEDEKPKQNNAKSIWMRESRNQISHSLKLAHGGYCKICNFDNLLCLEFHHVNPAEKLFSVLSINLTENTFDKAFLESLKCILLCRNCHKKIEYGHERLPTVYPRPYIAKPDMSHLWRKCNKRYCLDCEKSISFGAFRCAKCADNKRRENMGLSKPSSSSSNDPSYYYRSPQINWPDTDTLIKKIYEINYTNLGKELGVSDNAIRKHLKARGITPPSRDNVKAYRQANQSKSKQK